MEFSPESFRSGLPKIRSQPTCAVCHEGKAFVVSSQGLVCGKCYLNNQSIREDHIILEAAKIMRGRGITA